MAKVKKQNEPNEPNEPSAEVRHWLAEIASAREREKDFRKTGKMVNEIYSGKKPDEIPFNILYSNTETLLPALFSQTPRPVVQRRFKDDDPMGKAASTAAQRMLEYLCDTNVEGYETLEQSMTAATIDALLPGRGVTGVKYDAEIVEPNEESGSPGSVKWEQVCTDSRKWDGIHFGFARKWSKVPWIAYEEFIDREEATRLFGKDVAGKITYTADEQKDDESDEKGTGTGGRDSTEDEESGRDVALVYQIWDRSGGKKIRYISPQYNDGYLKVDDDPYQITGFFNCPKPLQFLQKSNDMMPVAMYTLYENQAKELNRLTVRIQKVVSAIKVRGAYDGALGTDIEKILASDDLDLVPTDNAASMGNQGGIDKMIWLWPVEKLILVLQQLVAAREACKRVIYEITGVSDIVRGQSVASETLGAQKIKEAWGTLRLKRLQRETQRYARDILRIMIEVAANKLSVKTWAQATGLPFVTREQKVQAQQAVQIAQVNGAQPNPTALQAVQAPVWEDIMALLQNDMQRAYRIDIETNSTIDVEASEDQKNISEVMQAIAQFLHGVGPLVEKGVMSVDIAKNMLLTIVRRFRFGGEVEDSIKNMQPPKPQDDGKAAESQAKMAEMQASNQAEMAKLQQKAQQEISELQQKNAAEKGAFEGEMRQAVLELQQKAQQEMAELQQKHAEAMAKNDATYRTEQMKANIARDADLKRAQIEKEKAIEVAMINAGAKTRAESEKESAGEGGEQEESCSMKDLMAMMQEIMTQMTAPKMIERGQNGMAISIGGRPIIYGEDGRPAGLQ